MHTQPLRHLLLLLTLGPAAQGVLQPTPAW